MTKMPHVSPLRWIGLAALGLAATAAQAQTMVTARVLSTEPVVQQVPVSDCGPYGAQPTGAGAAVGAITGGLIGSQFGHGGGHAVGALLGAVGGAILGNTAEASQRAYQGCATHYQNQIIGYNVTYDLGGQTYRTQTARAPGQWIQVPAPAYAYNDPGAVQSYPVQPAPVATYPVPAYPAYPAYPAAGESSPQPGEYGQTYPYPSSYPSSYPPGPVYNTYPAAPVVVSPAPVYVRPVGINLSIGGRIGRHGGVGLGIGF
ncbi:glycine zipper 2TM domain-containing protein [Ottowia sp.]|uniref:glycine zipper 2TM domain-containing protein n=1 Tax=Ottowia sp. TaxID=1898956 RepID=UPI003A842E8A